MPDTGKTVYLTFDDGPVPEVTPWLLDLLKEQDIKACFFCVGENVKKHANIYLRILREGHLTGNHTFNHLVGLKTTVKEYVDNVELAARYIKSALFRPPHGFLRRGQYQILSGRYRIIMWDVVSCDYRRTLTPVHVVDNVMQHVRPGSIITFHDSLKAERNLRIALPDVIKKLKEEGYSFGTLQNLKAPRILTAEY
ncbi:MAG: polysaccharide deacetylase family protein [Bacteroidales bacterium]|nr:polysaccharide deacetylase family protein [Bacteroidales bacterium]